MKFTGNLNIGTCFGKEIGSYPIDDKCDYYNRAAMVVDTMMKAGMSLFKQAEVSHSCHRKYETDAAVSKACAIMNTLFAWKDIPAKRSPDCAVSWLDDAWCTLHAKYEELQEKEIA